MVFENRILVLNCSKLYGLLEGKEILDSNLNILNEANIVNVTRQASTVDNSGGILQSQTFIVLFVASTGSKQSKYSILVRLDSKSKSSIF